MSEKSKPVDWENLGPELLAVLQECVRWVPGWDEHWTTGLTQRAEAVIKKARGQ